MASAVKTEILDVFEETGSHYTKIKAVQAARISTFILALLTTIVVLYDQFSALLYKVDTSIIEKSSSVF